MLLRPKPSEGESEAGYWLRLAFVHGVANPLRMSEAMRPATINARVKLCPACLSQPADLWQARWTSAALWCERHSVWLVDRCAACNRRWTWSNVRFNRCACGAAHAMRPVQSLPPGFSLCVAGGDWQMETLRWIGALALHGLLGRPAKKAATQDMQLTAGQATRGYELVRQWPEGWSQLLDELRVPSQPADGPRHFNAEWPHLMAKIRAVRNAADRARMEAATQAYVLASRRSNSPVIGRNMAPAPTLRSLATEAGIGLRRLTIALLEGQAPVTGSRFKRRRVVAVPDRVIQTEVLRRQSMSRAAAARALGLSPSRIDQLVGEVLHETPHGLDKADVESLGASVKRTPLPETVRPGLCSLGEAMRLLIPNEATTSFISALHQGVIGPPAGHSRTAIGDLLIDRDAVRSWWARRAKGAATFLSLRRVAVALDIKEEVVTQLVRAALIETVVQQCGRRKARFVRRDELLRFSAHYCKLKVLADSNAVPARWAYQWAIDTGLPIVTGPRVDGGRQYFIRMSVQGLV